MQEIINAINTIWDEIASDAFEAVGGEDMSAAEVVELCIDADRLRIRDPEAYAIFDEMEGTVTEKMERITAAMPYEIYANC